LLNTVLARHTSATGEGRHVVRHLSVIDSKLNMEAHAANVVHCSFYQLQQLRCIQRSFNYWRLAVTRYCVCR